MKKSQLRKIIRESIKQLMTEQSSGVYHRWQGQGNQNGNCKPSGIQNKHTTPGCLNSPTCNTPQGNHDAWVAMGSPNPGEFVRGDGTSNIGPFTGCWKYLGTAQNPQTSQYGAAPYTTSLTYTTLTNCNDCWTSMTTGCPGWSNYSNWESTFTSLPNFSSSNPNQPCQFLCQRNTQWSTQIQNVGPNWAAQLQCKIDKVQDLMQTHNCASSNAPAC